MKLIDIGANLGDGMYQGLYHGSETKKHEPDLPNVLKRAWEAGLDKIIVTGTNLEGSKTALEIANTDAKLYATVGVHPTCCTEFRLEATPEDYIANLRGLIRGNRGKVVALGEIGLDYERTTFCDIATQKRFFRYQLEELGKEKLPMFLHCRNAAEDLVRILSENQEALGNGGVVHSFDGTEEEMNKFLELGLYIGINGCSLKTEENCKLIQKIPLDKLLLETDSPWCGIRPSHYSNKLIKTKFDSSKKWSSNLMSKSRNEPQTLLNILEIVSTLREMDEKELADKVYENTTTLFKF